MTHPLLELQAADTMADQLRHRRDHLVEREQLQASKGALVRWNEARILAKNRFDELAAQLRRIEAASDDIDAKRADLEKKLTTIIAPREAEALQREIAELVRQRSALDDDGLAALDEQARLDDELSGLAAQEEELRDAYLAADAALASVESDIDSEIARVEERLTDLRKQVDKPLLRRYDRLREGHLVGAASLSGSRCDGCHIDLSAVEVDDVRDRAKKTGVSDCPQCGRLLVV